ncbi:MltF family protein [Mongoliitalea daihaiensis]|uniref:transglycosylase SLT domain-containing protein n=1 Tax=Mongoliitalea daihaiensis TaxID=2782006 RepID=UPI001F3ABD51|nr:transporter substrate-binding domain-containing protein [Mongoliitalea daihaiensis]UJP66474.1 transporter substrate-binding domain-containing protein [Mongoliitalea daihaiensis]
MRKFVYIVSLFSVLFLFGVQCTPKEQVIVEENFWENPTSLDLEEIQKRGFIRAIVDNSTTSYYIYKGRRMGYEFEMLKNLAAHLGVRLHLIVKSDIQEAFKLLNQGKADIIAMNFEVHESRFHLASFSEPLGQMGTVLVQREGASKIQSWEELDGKTIHIRKDAIYKSQLCAIQEQYEINLTIIESNLDSDALIKQVQAGKIAFTIADKVEALVNATYHSNLNIDWEIAPKADVAWAVRKNAPRLQEELNQWIDSKTGSGYVQTLYAKYFKNSNNSHYRSTSTFSSVAGNRISPYDEIIQKGAEQLGWDWRLLASLVYKESNFNSQAESYAGAQGLLQLMPVTLQRFGVQNPQDPLESLMGGVNYLKYLDKFWKERVPETNERIQFILASYNVGHGHVEDAWRLAIKYGKNTQLWENVSIFLELKSNPMYYKDPVVKSGYAKGHMAVNYVEEILLIYESYRTLISP